MATAPSSRRIGSADSKTRAQLLDAAERLLREEGYAAVTSRRVAAKAGLKPQLVHYYFRTMDDLFVEVFRRRAEENMARVRAGRRRRTARCGRSGSSTPTARGAAFTHRVRGAGQPPQGDPRRDRPLRRAVPGRAGRGADRGARGRAASTEDQLPPIVALLMMTGLSQVLALEDTLGVTAGHDTTVAFVEQAIARLEARPTVRDEGITAPEGIT